MQGNCSALPPVRPGAEADGAREARAPSRILRPYPLVVVVPAVVAGAVVVVAVVVVSPL